MNRYIDVHAASCTLAVISEAGKRLTDFPVETNGQALVEAVRMIPGRKHLVFEEGLQSAWLYETLKPTPGRNRSGGSHGEPGAEERQARCLRPGGGSASRIAGKARVQSTAAVRPASRAVPDTHHHHPRSGPNPGSHQEPVSIKGGYSA
jgi:hypothetical protein